MKVTVVAWPSSPACWCSIPAAAWQRQVSALMGIEGPSTAGLPAHAGRRAVGRAALRRRVAGRARRDQGAGAHAHPALAPAPRGRAVHRHRDRRRRAHHADQRRAVPRLPGGRQSGVPAAELDHPGRDQPAHAARTIRQPNVVRAVGHARLPGPQLRGHRAGRRRRWSGLNGRPAKEPIRVYAGLQTADTDAARMDVVWSANSNAPAPSTASCSSSSRPPARDGSIRSPPAPSRPCTTATPRSSACSTRICPAGSRSSGTARSRSRPAGC